MSKAMLIALAALLATPPAFAAKNVTVEELSREIASLGKTKDAKAAGQLYELQLTQRLSAKELNALEAELPGPESRRALVAVTDQAEFLDPPPNEIPNQPAPSVDQQRAIIAKSIDYAEATLHQLPNLYARRDTIRYEDVPAGLRNERTDTIMPYQPLHPVSRSIATVLYRDGKEIVQKQAAQQGASTPAATGMVTFGEFGPIFSVLYGDLPKGNLRWGYWEHGKIGLEAVFRFNVAKRDSHYLVRYCCIIGQIFQQFPAYHGEITIDPSKGTILRLTLIADMTADDPLANSELMVQYGSVEVGGKKYFCPVRNISVSRAPAQSVQSVVKTGTFGAPPPDESRLGVPLETMLNEAVFDQYHIFRGDVQILTADNAEGASAPAAPEEGPSGAGSSSATTAMGSATAAVNGSISEGTSDVSATMPANEGAAPTAAASQPSTPSGATAMAQFATPPNAPSSVASAAPPVASSSTPEVAEVAPGPIPQTLAVPQASGKSGFSLSLNARLVDVDVTAVDRKGRPVTGLTKEDFVLSDDGRKQALRSFSRISGAASASPKPAGTAAEPVLYSNLPAAAEGGGPQAANASAPESSTILLLDPTSLDFPDLNYARQQILKFLSRLPAMERVGLYIRTGLGFRILAEETADHAAVSSALREWALTAKDLAVAQEAEMRNRQQFDTVGNNAFVDGNDLATLNGNMIMPGDGLPTPDPKLSQEGGVDPARSTFGVLVGVAAHMNAIPGHKNLVWVASDNVLENWSGQTPGGNVENSRIGGAGMRAQEALNDAHVSIYPLDASELETSATDASLENASAELSASAGSMNPHANDEARMKGGRAQAEMQQDMHAIQPAIQQAAEATGGRAFPRNGEIAGELRNVIEDGDATYQLSFAPDTAPDGKYHKISVTVPGRRGIKLQYRTGYLYAEEPTTLKARFEQAVWQPQDETGIGLSAQWGQASEGASISVSIAAGDVSVKKQNDRWTDKLDIFLVQRDGTGTRAAMQEKTLALNLTAATYQNLLRAGIPFAEYIDHPQASGTVRIIVVDENSGRMGSVTLPELVERASK